MGVFIDRTTGKLSSLPVGGEDNLNLDVRTKRGSNLLLAQWAAYASNSCNFEAFHWDGTSFAPVDGYPKKISEPCPSPDADEEVGKSKAAAVSAATPDKSSEKLDISGLFPTDSFCKYLDLEKITPKNARKIEVRSLEKGDSEDLTIWSFSANLYGLHVIGSGEAYGEGYGAQFLIFNNPPRDVINKLGAIYGHRTDGIPKAVNVYLDGSEKGPNGDPQMTWITGTEQKEVKYINGQSSINCGVTD